MVDAADSKSAVRKNVLVRFQSRAQISELVNPLLRRVLILYYEPTIGNDKQGTKRYMEQSGLELEKMGRFYNEFSEAHW